MPIIKTCFKVLFIFICVISTLIVKAQDRTGAKKLISEGVAFHDKNNFEGAISKYNEALKLDTNNISALYEKAYSLNSISKLQESISCCQQAIRSNHGEETIGLIYLLYGNNLDELNQSAKAVEKYDEGILKFPKLSMLYFNKAIAQEKLANHEEAIISCQKAVELNPTHPGSQNLLGRLIDAKGLRIPAILVYSRFMAIEPESRRKSQDLARINQLFGKYVIRGADPTKPNDVSVNIPQTINIGTKVKSAQENDFSITDLLLSMSTAIDYDDKYKNESPAERFERKLTRISQSLSEIKESRTGFYWTFYTPYFIQMQKMNFIKVLSHLSYQSDPVSAAWLKNNSVQLQSFLLWEEKYKWEKD